MTYPEFVQPSPTRWGQENTKGVTTITIDDGYRPNCEFEHPCGLGDIFWKAAINEEGWWCATCKKEFGFTPALDRILLSIKVHNLLMDLHMATLLYVSNGSHGDSIVDMVMHRCVEDRTFDQGSILRYIIESDSLGDGSYWRERAANVLNGALPDQEAFPPESPPVGSR